MKTRSLVLASTLACFLFAPAAPAQLRITLPKRSKPTPVQKLNQDGVKAVQKHDYEKAKRLFYKAYLLDPNDPFTLNNLGYIAELEGQVDRAQRFYALAAEQNSEATIAAASASDMKGKSVAEVAGRTEDAKLLVNRYNVEAIGLLMKDRAPEADLLLQKALAIDSANAFTLNNMGFAKEKEGELEQALSFYVKAANLNSRDTIVVTADKSWRGKPISEVAARNADKLRKIMQSEQTPEVRVARLNLQGVSAMNRNEPKLARRYFEQAYKLDPEHAFTLNNMGYLAELEGDRETADFYYARAQEARGQGRVDVATRADAEGRPIGEVAGVGEQKVQARMEAARQARAREGGPVLLRRRDGSPIIEPERPAEPVQPPQTQPQQELLPPLPESQQPPVTQPTQPPHVANPQPPSGGLLMPLPDDQQPETAKQPDSQQPTQDVLPPLPENQQPPAARGRQDQPQPNTGKASQQ